ncbi:helix-turn-helix transcriptional regulator [Buttiauxella noackiae]|uniref:helix-turn-helix transcriptional regulator n=1 Tax=Buttiauxella noackiae TaxID=82992 RepID=UPI0005584BC2|nr:LuxR C-terminal-related transcriptional regulator [Buttiauxella noackiae]
MSFEINMVVMSPNSYFCSGVKSIIKAQKVQFRKINLLPDCKSLRELRQRLHEYDIQIVITEVCGINETLADWFHFSYWFTERKFDTSLTLVCGRKLHHLCKLHHTFTNLVSPQLSPEDLCNLLKPFSSSGKRFQDSIPQKTNNINLSSNEAEVVQLFWQGMTGKEMASYLGTSVGSVSASKRRAMDKLGVSNNVSLMKLGAWGHSDRNLQLSVLCDQRFPSEMRRTGVNEPEGLVSRPERQLLGASLFAIYSRTTTK